MANKIHRELRARGFPGGCRTPQSRQTRSRQEHLPGALSLLAPARQTTTVVGKAFRQCAIEVFGLMAVLKRR